MLRGLLLRLLCSFGFISSAALAEAAVLRVPQNHPTIQVRWGAASAGDEIRDGQGRTVELGTPQAPQAAGTRRSPHRRCDSSPDVTQGACQVYLPARRVSTAGNANSGFRSTGGGSSRPGEALVRRLRSLCERTSSFHDIASTAPCGCTKPPAIAGASSTTIRHLTLPRCKCLRNCTGGDGIVIASPAGDRRPGRRR